MPFCNWKTAPLLVIGLLPALILHADEGSILGAAMCKRPAAGEACLTAWDFTAVPHDAYWVERFMPNETNYEWQTVAGPFSGARGMTDESMEGGFLYRVVGCNDKAGSTECVGSTVFWAPLRPKGVDDIPERIDTPQAYYKPRKSPTSVGQVIDYNWAMLRKLVLSIDMTSMPPMTELPFDDLHDLPDDIAIDDATIDYNVQFAYPKHVKPIRRIHVH